MRGQVIYCVFIQLVTDSSAVVNRKINHPFMPVCRVMFSPRMFCMFFQINTRVQSLYRFVCESPVNCLLWFKNNNFKTIKKIILITIMKLINLISNLVNSCLIND